MPPKRSAAKKDKDADFTSSTGGPAMKVKKKEVSAEDAILEYLENQYRPYSVNDIVQNLHGAFTKTVTVKALESLTNDGKIITKLLGKMSISVANKVELTDDMNAVDKDKEMADLNKQLNEVEKEIVNIQEELSRITKYPDDKTLDESLRELKAEVSKYEKRLEASSTKASLSPESVHRVKKITEDITKESDRRLKMYKNFMGFIAEFIDPKTLANELGLEEPLLV